MHARSRKPKHGPQRSEAELEATRALPGPALAASTVLSTPDGRYIVVRGRLWRKANPSLTPAKRAKFTSELMAARRAVAAALRSGDAARLRSARAAVHAAKCALGERGAVWWNDGARDYTRFLVRNTPYASWYAAVSSEI